MLVDIVYDLQVKVTDLEISYKSKKKVHLSLYSYTIKTFCWILLSSYREV